MATIINNQDFMLTAEQQQAINNAAAEMGLNEVIVGEKDYSEDEVFVPIFFESEDNGDAIDEFAFNLNLETNQIFG